MDKAEHTAIRLRPALWLIEADAVDGGDVVGVDRLEGGKQRRNAFGTTAILVPPRAARMIAQRGAGEGRPLDRERVS
jgi:hypothetical protein